MAKQKSGCEKELLRDASGLEEKAERFIEISRLSELTANGVLPD